MRNSGEEAGTLVKDSTTSGNHLSVPVNVPQWLTRVTGHYNNGGVTGTSHNGDPLSFNDQVDPRRGSKTFHLPKVDLLQSNSNQNSPRTKHAQLPNIQFEVTTTDYDAVRNSSVMTPNVDADGKLVVEVKQLEDCSKQELNHHSQTPADSTSTICGQEFKSFKHRLTTVVPFGEKFPVATKQSLDALREKSLGRTEDEELFKMDDHFVTGKPAPETIKHIIELPNNWFFKQKTSRDESSNDSVEHRANAMRELNFQAPINM